MSLQQDGGTRAQRLVAGGGDLERATVSGYATDPAMPFFLERYADAYRLELDAFVRGLHGEKADIVSGADGLRALEIADACDRSLKSRATVLLASLA